MEVERTVAYLWMKIANFILDMKDLWMVVFLFNWEKPLPLTLVGNCSCLDNLPQRLHPSITFIQPPPLYQGLKTPVMLTCQFFPRLLLWRVASRKMQDCLFLKEESRKESPLWTVPSKTQGQNGEKRVGCFQRGIKTKRNSLSFKVIWERIPQQQRMWALMMILILMTLMSWTT